MNNWRVLLRDADPIGRGEPATMPNADAVRRLVVSATRSSAPDVEHWFRSALVMAATITVVVCLGAVTGRRFAETDRAERPGVSAPVPGQLRQLQFSTPGGTRIIWTFNPDLKINETTP